MTLNKGNLPPTPEPELTWEDIAAFTVEQNRAFVEKHRFLGLLAIKLARKLCNYVFLYCDQIHRDYKACEVCPASRCCPSIDDSKLYFIEAYLLALKGKNNANKE